MSVPVYTRTTFANGTSPAISETNLNNLEAQVDSLSKEFTDELVRPLTTNGTIVDADEVQGNASADSFHFVKWTWATIKAFLKTYFDTLYMALTGNQTVAGVKTFSSSPVVPTPAVDNNTTNAASTAFVIGQAAGTAPLAPAVTAAIGSSTRFARMDHVHPTNFTATATDIKMNGTQAVGSLTTFPRADHVHPVDTSRAPLASPAFTGNPTAPTPATSDNDTSIATTAFVRAQLLAYIYPVGCYYTQYPDAASNTDATEFPTTQAPATLFGGTWVEQWATESVFFRTRGTLSDDDRVSGSQPDAFQGHRHTVTGQQSIFAGGLFLGAGNDAVDNTITSSDPVTNGTDGTPRTASETRTKNRRIKVWKRTA